MSSPPHEDILADEMPVSAYIDRDARLVVTTATGVVTREEFISHIEDIWQQPGVGSFDEILDATTADVSNLSSEDLSAIVNSGVVFDPGGEPRLALCVSSTLAYGIARMYGTMRETHTDNSRVVRVFTTTEEGRAWLDGKE